MKRLYCKVVLFLVVLSGVNYSIAQENPYFVGVRYGYSMPLGQFASKKYDDGAYALPGSTFSAEGVHYFQCGFGVGLNFSQSYFPIANQSYLDDYDSGDPSVQYIYLKSDPYQVRTYMAGLFYRVPISGKISASFKTMSGVCWAQSPYLFFTGNYLIGNLFHIVTPAKSTRIAFLLGSALNYKVFDHVSLILELECSYAESKFTFWKEGLTIKDVQFMKMPVLGIQPGINITF
jgi:hypothetical protein